MELLLPFISSLLFFTAGFLFGKGSEHTPKKAKNHPIVSQALEPVLTFKERKSLYGKLYYRKHRLQRKR